MSQTLNFQEDECVNKTRTSVKNFLLWNVEHQLVRVIGEEEVQPIPRTRLF